jgi:hypothetical protein
MERFFLAVALTVVAGNPALAKGGTNMHEMAASRHEDDQSITYSIDFIRCGHGRFRDSHTHRCVGRADSWR